MLSTSNANEAVPTQTSVTIPANSSSASFTIDAVDDALLDGDQLVTISAAAAGLAGGNASLLVNDIETLTVVAAQSPTIESAGAGATTVTITRPNTDNSLPLTVTLTDTSARLTLPATAEIPANEASVTVPVDVIDTENVDGNTTVTIRANAPGYQQSQTTIVVEDDDGGMIRPGNILVAVDDRYVREYRPDGALIQTVIVSPQGSQLRDVVVNDQGDIELINGNSVLTNIDVDASGRIVAAGSSTSISNGWVVITNEALQAVEAFSVTSGLLEFPADRHRPRRSGWNRRWFSGQHNHDQR